jgi:hypothetical protein
VDSETISISRIKAIADTLDHRLASPRCAGAASDDARVLAHPQTRPPQCRPSQSSDIRPWCIERDQRWCVLGPATAVAIWGIRHGPGQACRVAPCRPHPSGDDQKPTSGLVGRPSAVMEFVDIIDRHDGQRYPRHARTKPQRAVCLSRRTGEGLRPLWSEQPANHRRPLPDAVAMIVVMAETSVA